MADGKGLENLVITVSGPHGAGKTTYAKIIAQNLNLRFVSAGHFFREMAEERGLSLERLTRLAAEDPSIDRLVDERTKAEAARGGVVIEGQLAGWMAKDEADIKIYLTAPHHVRVRRIAERDGIALNEASAQTDIREEAQRERYRRYYGVDATDLSIYDIIIDTGSLSKEETLRLIMQKITEELKKRGLIG